MQFSGLLPADLVAALEKQEIRTPTPIQVMAIPVLRAGEDACLVAQTGTGKTLAYLLPLFTRIDQGLAATQGVIVAPTHELAIQIHRQSCALAQDSGRPIRSTLLVGEAPIARQVEKLKAKPQVVVGSPGRLLELIGRGKLKMAQVRCVVLDEADRLLADESRARIDKILAAAPADRQRVFASATMDDEARQGMEAVAPGVQVLSPDEEPVNPDIEHLYVVCEERDKPEVLRKLVHAFGIPRALVFVHRNEGAQRVAAKLAHHTLAAGALSAEAGKEERKRVMEGIRKGTLRIVVASDLAARGLDIPDVTHVFNLDMPTTSQAYLHRVGRTGRAGAKGIAVSLVTQAEERLVRRHERELQVTLRRVQVQGGTVWPAGGQTSRMV